MKKETKSMLFIFFTFCFLSFCVGIIAGASWQTTNIMRIANSVQIEEMNIDLNETKIMTAMMNYAQENGYIDKWEQEKIQEQLKKEQENYTKCNDPNY